MVIISRIRQQIDELDVLADIEDCVLAKLSLIQQRLDYEKLLELCLANPVFSLKDANLDE